MKSNPTLVVHMIGNAHIDPVWLWPWQAGVDEVLATFRSAVSRCEEYPEFIFTRGEAWTYEWVERLDPALFRRVQNLVEKGQWHITGGQYLQPDCNLPTELGFRKCIEHGQRYFTDRFGVKPTVGYNVDSFGHAAALPDIYGDFGYVGYCFQRPRPGQLRLPANTFRWVGLRGGSLIGARIVPVYVTRTDDLWGQITLAIEAANPAIGHAMCFYGVGNHGGGPTKANIEFILQNRDAFPGARLEFSTPERFLAAVRDQRLPLVKGELQNCFPGCYSVMHEIKQTQYRAEKLLELADDVIDLVGDETRRVADKSRIDAAWRDLLFTQFHDILAGTSSARAWASVRAMQGRARIAAEEVILENTRMWSLRTVPPKNVQRLIVINPARESFDGWIEAEPFIDFDRWRTRSIADETGKTVPFQQIQPDGNVRTLYRILFPLKVPARSHRILDIRDDSPPSAISAPGHLAVNATRMRGGGCAARLGRTGVFHWSVGGIEAGLCELRLRRDETDTWTMRADRFEGEWTARFRGTGWTVEENGPLRVSCRNSGRIGRSPCVLRLQAATGSQGLRLLIEINWCESQRILCLRQALSRPAARWGAAVVGGEIVRQAGPVEMPVQGWVAVRVPGGTLAMITPDATSASMRGDSVQWTLLRSPQMALSGALPSVHHGKSKTTDQGVHRFEFHLCLSKRAEAALYRRLLRQTLEPCVVFDHYLGLDRPPWRDSPPRTLWLASEHRARREGRMAHLVDDGSPPNMDEECEPGPQDVARPRRQGRAGGPAASEARRNTARR